MYLLANKYVHIYSQILVIVILEEVTGIFKSFNNQWNPVELGTTGSFKSYW